jgi:hypothetical protein
MNFKNLAKIPSCTQDDKLALVESFVRSQQLFSAARASQGPAIHPAQLSILSTPPREPTKQKATTENVCLSGFATPVLKPRNSYRYHLSLSVVAPALLISISVLSQATSRNTTHASKNAKQPVATLVGWSKKRKRYEDCDHSSHPTPPKSKRIKQPSKPDVIEEVHDNDDEHVASEYSVSFSRYAPMFLKDLPSDVKDDGS